MLKDEKIIIRNSTGIVTEGTKADYEDGKLVIKGDIPLHSIEIQWDFPVEKDAEFFCDAWERAYGDLEWTSSPKTIMPWYFVIKTKDEIFCFGVKTGPNALCYWHYENNKITLTADIRNGKNDVELNGRLLDVCQVVTEKYTGDIFESMQDFCEKMCDNPRLPSRPIFGGNDWYCNYGDNSFEKIDEHTRRIVECSKSCDLKPYMVIDDGWEFCHHQSDDDDKYYNGGPWEPNRNFKDMKRMSERIAEIGVIPGIWFRPLWTTEKVPEEMVLKVKHTKYTLDPSTEMALKQVKDDITKICSWGYKLIKHDFSTFDIFGKWGNDKNFLECDAEFADKTLTTAEIIKNFYKAIRSAAGDDCIIIGCNTISHLAAGYFEIQRTGDDTSGFEWERTKKMGINTLAYRMCQHKKFYAVDADCVGITKAISWRKNRKWLDVLSKSGTPLFVSIASDAYTDEVKEDIINAFLYASQEHNVSVPKDFDCITPTEWKSDLGTDIYDWE